MPIDAYGIVASEKRRAAILFVSELLADCHLQAKHIFGDSVSNFDTYGIYDRVLKRIEEEEEKLPGRR